MFSSFLDFDGISANFNKYLWIQTPENLTSMKWLLKAILLKL